jgi:hypothetical protein
MLATELFVHFHDYYFVYACQPRLYIMSLWASWTKVAPPYLRPAEYLVRTLATVACGSGATPRAAFADASEKLLDAITGLEDCGIRSPLFDELRRLLPDEKDEVFSVFKLAYYLIDHVRKYFASRTVAGGIDRITSDPFSGGSMLAEEYNMNVQTYGDPGAPLLISPIRYCLGGLVRELEDTLELNDYQWLTARNAIVIGSQWV